MSQKNNQPIPLTPDEWQEITQLEEVREAWGLNDAPIEDFPNQVYGVKFKFHSGSPGYVGELYILQGDVLTGDPPFMIGRREGKLFVFEF